ncbi:hypothetical protein KKB68_00090 [Patescibacteria group bacterium]|nr:hypothetical protein [Patescibacteria group bacterium]
MAIELIPKKSMTKRFSWLGSLFYLSLVLLIAVISSYFILSLFQKNANQTIEQLEQELAGIETQERKDLEQEVLNQKSKIDNFSNLLDAHQLSSNFFFLMEGLCHPKVFFSTVDLSVKTQKVSISAQTDSFQTLGQQLLILKEEDSVRDISLNKVTAGKEGKVDFFLNFSLNPEVFKKAQGPEPKEAD